MSFLKPNYTEEQKKRMDANIRSVTDKVLVGGISRGGAALARKLLRKEAGFLKGVAQSRVPSIGRTAANKIGRAGDAALRAIKKHYR